MKAKIFSALRASYVAAFGSVTSLIYQPTHPWGASDGPAWLIPCVLIPIPFSLSGMWNTCMRNWNQKCSTRSLTVKHTDHSTLMIAQWDLWVMDITLLQHIATAFGQYRWYQSPISCRSSGHYRHGHFSGSSWEALIIRSFALVFQWSHTSPQFYCTGSNFWFQSTTVSFSDRHDLLKGRIKYWVKAVTSSLLMSSEHVHACAVPRMALLTCTGMLTIRNRHKSYHKHHVMGESDIWSNYEHHLHRVCMCWSMFCLSEGQKVCAILPADQGAWWWKVRSVCELL